MKLTTQNKFVGVLGAILISGLIAVPASAKSSDNERHDRDELHGIQHSANGTGVVHVPADFFFPGSVSFYESYTIHARQERDGSVKGTVVVESWGEGTPETRTTAVIEVNCLSFVANTAYYGGVVTWTDEPFAFVGMEAVGYVTDGKRCNGDLAWFGPAFLFLADGQDCSARPSMAQMPIESGNYTVR